MEDNALELEKVEKKIQSIGNDITIIDSLLNFLDLGMSSDYDLTNADLSNLTTVIKKMTKILKLKYERLEHLLNI